MKVFAAIILLLIYLQAGSIVVELAKIPVLLEHYAHHKEENKGTNFLNYIYNHYMVADDKDNDKKEDDRLPFKTLVQSSYADYIIVKVLEIIPHTMHISDKQKCPCITFSLQYVLPSIWQPPRG